MNLLTGQTRHRAMRGDTSLMVQARRAFLAEGHYAPIADGITHLVNTYMPSPNVILDCGCGEGYYLGKLCASLQHEESSAFGLDIARNAVQLAAKAHHSQGWIVADVYNRLPFADHSISLLLNIFAPRNGAEYARVLLADGKLIVVIPTANHLSELRGHIPLLGVEPAKRDRMIARLSPALQLLEETKVTFGLTLSAESAIALVQMMPSARHLHEDSFDLLRRLDSVSATASVLVLLFAPGDLIH